MKPMRHTAGFTLLELLVVISIMGILIAIGVQSYTTLNKQARDGRRISDLQTIRTALESYRSQNGDYPADLSPIVPSGYLNNLPEDPVPDRQYVYLPITTAQGQASYALCASRELAGSLPASGCNGQNCGTAGACNYQLGPLGEQ
ncbi:MAG: type II secretion system GspH family protein [Candidatus Roizmanbacteria bacterium]|nr:type II secretion system GspH family protein [Candidatus Roizmanbacteria bacterium]